MGHRVQGEDGALPKFIELDLDLLSDEFSQEWRAIPVSEADPEAGTLRVVLAEIPPIERDRLEGLLRARARALVDLSLVAMRESETTGPRTAEKIFSTLGEDDKRAAALAEIRESLRALRREVVTKCVVDHHPEDAILRVGGARSLPEETEDKVVQGITRRYGVQASEARTAIRTGEARVRFFPSTWTLGKGSATREFPGASTNTIAFYEAVSGGTLLEALANAAFRWSKRVYLPPEELWKRAKEKQEKEAAASAPPSEVKGPEGGTLEAEADPMAAKEGTA